jgi:methylglutaconyl-CoA hydratase
MSYTQIQVTTEHHVARVVINRPTQRNALSLLAVEELSRAFLSLATDEELRCVVLTGSGSEAFCAGADLRELHEAKTPEQRRAFFVAIANLITSMRACPVPIVSVIHGFALAGGLGLVASSDIALAADDAVFGLPEVAVGLAPMVVMSPLEAVVDPRMLSYLALTGERISATEACKAGLITRVIAKDSLNAEAQAVCATIRQRGPIAVRATKAALRDIPLRSRDAYILELADRSALISLGAEAAEGIAAFQEKRAPAWKK